MDPLGETREREKAKYHELAADMARQWLAYTVTIVPVVLGDLGPEIEACSIELSDAEAARQFSNTAQRENQCGKVMKRHLVAD